MYWSLLRIAATAIRKIGSWPSMYSMPRGPSVCSPDILRSPSCCEPVLISVAEVVLC